MPYYIRVTPGWKLPLKHASAQRVLEGWAKMETFLTVVPSVGFLLLET